MTSTNGRRREAGRLRAAWALVLLAFASCAGPPPRGSYRVDGRTYTPLTRADGYVETGVASWYGSDFHGKLTSNGEVYDMYAHTCAHKLLPLGTQVRVTNLDNGRVAVARVNDRGPFVDGRVVDLSYTMANELGLVGSGVARVRVEAVAGPGGLPPPGRSLEGPFTCQVGAFTVPSRAEDLAKRLREEFSGVSIVLYDRGDAVFRRVRVGTFRSPGDAQTCLSDLRTRGFDPFLVRRD
ncbi:MAG: septal ring lytic transglycosylase RlpA family protein [Deltaproteobacteria bacterium]|nr:septal ring lytic transglycosylase RlpA family protein [Deltaproteobacteria bacterium]